jgi:beta-glucanase (GH16 family)
MLKFMTVFFGVYLFVSSILNAVEFCEEPVFQEDFLEDLNEAVWLKATWGFPGSSSLFDPENVSVGNDDGLELSVVKISAMDGDGVQYDFTGAELRTMDPYVFGYGKYEFEIKIDASEGLNESFFIAWDGGEYARHHQYMGFQFLEQGYSILFSTGPDEELNTNHDAPTNSLDTIVSMNKSFYKFTIEYTEDSVTWYLDDEKIRKQSGSSDLELPDQKMNIIFRSWLPTDNLSKISEYDFPTTTRYKYIKFYPVKEDETSCEVISTEPEEEVVAEEEDTSDTTSSDSDSTTVTTTTTASLEELTTMVSSLASGNFYMLGTPVDIPESSLSTVFESVKIVWVFENGAWSAFSPNSIIKTAITQNGIATLSKIPKYYGFWIEK